MYTESCCYCGKEGLKRENASLYELNGWLHCCGTTPAHRSVNYYSSTQFSTNYDFDERLDFINANREVNYDNTSYQND